MAAALTARVRGARDGCSNDNSSRFGKFTKMVVESQHGSVTSGNVETLLLESVRVAFQNEGERNFHVFYQLLRGLRDESKRASLKLPAGGLEGFRIVSQSGCDAIEGVDDAEAFGMTTAAFSSFGSPSARGPHGTASRVCPTASSCLHQRSPPPVWLPQASARTRPSTQPCCGCWRACCTWATSPSPTATTTAARTRGPWGAARAAVRWVAAAGGSAPRRASSRATW